MAYLPVTKVELTVSCRNLKDMDLLSLSDPMVVLYVPDANSKNPRNPSWKEYGRTERVKNNLNPDFTKSFEMDYFFEMTQPLCFRVYDIDNASATVADDDFIGEVKTTLGEIIGSRGQCKTYDVLHKQGQRHGSMIVRAEEKSTCLDVVTLSMEAKGLAKKDGLFRKSDPFLIISRCNEDNSFTVVHKTEVVKQNLNPSWNAVVIPVTKLCNNDYMRPLKIECYDWDSDNKSDFIGEFQTNLNELLSQKEFKLFDGSSKKKAPKHTGTVFMRQAAVTKQYSFLEYLSGGYEISMIVSVDFTGSNGNPATPSSLHYCGNPAVMNQYECAIRGVGEILAYYDADKMFPAYGYGAKMPDGSVSHCFALNGNPQMPECPGIEGVVQAYKQALRNVSLFGPTLFAPTIQMVSNMVRQSVAMNHPKYFILLIITDGIITDMKETIASIVDASSLPLSIIIVGVGNEDFAAMEVLDGDNKRLSANGRYAERDIVQFVPYNKYLNMDYSVLARDTLKELPGQFLDYMKKHNIKPSPRVQAQIPPMQQQQQQMMMMTMMPQVQPSMPPAQFQ